MRSFIKSHRREFSDDYDPDSVASEIEGLQQLPPLNQSPNKNAPGSPTSVKSSNKLQRLFLRSKSSSPNLQAFNILPPSSSNSSSSPTIRGTRTHEWGTASPRNSTSKPTTRESFESAELSNTSTLSGSNDLAPSTVKEEVVFLSPLDTVPEIPLASVSDPSLHQKSIRRRAKIFTKDDLEMASIMYPEELTNFSNDSIEYTELNLIENLHLNKNFDTKTKYNQDDAHSISGDSEFSFEQDTKAGRNMSIRYYKSPKENTPPSPEYRPGFYVNDLIDEDFDDDMNYLNEDDEFNDDEELFNRNYFLDDEVEQKVTTKPKLLDPQPHTPTENQTNTFQSNDMKSKKHSNGFENAINSYPSRTKRSLKYYQLPQILDQEYNTEKYTFLNDDDTHLANGLSNDSSDLYDSLLDEINNVPEDFDFENPSSHNSHPVNSDKTLQNRSKSLNSSLSRITRGTVFENSYQNSKFKTHDKTVTLFNRSRQNSVKSTKVTGFTDATPEKLIYSTPNGSFISPNPGFINESNLELSPISERSVDESP